MTVRVLVGILSLVGVAFLPATFEASNPVSTDPNPIKTESTDGSAKHSAKDAHSKEVKQDAGKAAAKGENEPAKDAPRKAPLKLVEEDPVKFALREYRVLLWLRMVPGDRFSKEFREHLVQSIQSSVSRHLGKAWKLQIVETPKDLAIDDNVAPEMLQELSANYDKLIWTELGSDRWVGNAQTVPIWVREYDFYFKEWGPAFERELQNDRQLARQVFDSIHRQFRIRGEIGPTDSNGKFSAYFQGLALQPKGSMYPLVRKGTPLRAFREFVGTNRATKKEEIMRTPIQWTYLVYKSSHETGVTSECDVESAKNNVIIGRSRRRTKILVLAASNSGEVSTELQFTEGLDQVPVVGFEVFARPQGKKTMVPVGSTDFRGRIMVERLKGAQEEGGLAEVESTDLPRVLRILLTTGPSVLASFPVVPGESDSIRCPVRIDPLLTEISGKVQALQSELIEVVARRALKKRELTLALEKKDAEALKRLGPEYNAMPDKAYFEKKLKDVKDYAEAVAKRNNKKVSPAIEKIFKQTEILFFRYFKDDKASTQITTQTVDPNAPPPAEGGDGKGDGKGAETKKAETPVPSPAPGPANAPNP